MQFRPHEFAETLLKHTTAPSKLKRLSLCTCVTEHQKYFWKLLKAVLLLSITLLLRGSYYCWVLTALGKASLENTQQPNLTALDVFQWKESLSSHSTCSVPLLNTLRVLVAGWLGSFHHSLLQRSEWFWHMLASEEIRKSWTKRMLLTALQLLSLPSQPGSWSVSWPQRSWSKSLKKNKEGLLHGCGQSACKQDCSRHSHIWSIQAQAEWGLHSVTHS